MIDNLNARTPGFLYDALGWVPAQRVMESGSNSRRPAIAGHGKQQIKLGLRWQQKECQAVFYSVIKKLSPSFSLIQ